MEKRFDQGLRKAVAERFGDHPPLASAGGAGAVLNGMLTRGSCRAFKDQDVPDDMLALAAAAALSSPSKSDLQQRDIILLRDPDQRDRLAALIGGQPWVAAAPRLLVFCGNNRRQRLWHDRHDVPFANDHLDALFNAAVDAAIALGAFVTAAEALGLGCCPISAVRNEAEAVSDLLNLPDHVFPVAGLAVGFPKAPATMSMRLPLAVTCHIDGYSEDELPSAMDAYDQARAQRQPYASQRLEATFGTATPYTWSLDKARQYSASERADFGAFIRRKGFKLD